MSEFRDPGFREEPLTGWLRWLALIGCALPLIVCVLGLVYLGAA